MSPNVSHLLWRHQSCHPGSFRPHHTWKTGSMCQARGVLHTKAVLQAYQANLLKIQDQGQSLTPELVAELCHIVDLALQTNTCGLWGKWIDICGWIWQKSGRKKSFFFSMPWSHPLNFLAHLSRQLLGSLELWGHRRRSGSLSLADTDPCLRPLGVLACRSLKTSSRAKRTDVMVSPDSIIIGVQDTPTHVKGHITDSPMYYSLFLIVLNYSYYEGEINISKWSPKLSQLCSVHGLWLCFFHFLFSFVPWPSFP